MEKYFAAWLIAWALVTFGVILYMSKKNGKRDLTKFTIVVYRSAKELPYEKNKKPEDNQSSYLDYSYFDINFYS